MKTICLNVHDLITIQINQEQSREYIKDINQPFSYFETQNIEHPDIILNIGDFEPQNDNCYVVDHKCYIKEDYIYCSEKLEKIPFKVEIIGLESFTTVINVYTGIKKLRQIILPSLLAQNIILRPIIDFKLLQRKVLSLHATGVVGTNGAMIILGRGGTHKTTIAMDLVRERKYYFLGDDRILIYKKNAYCFPIHFRLFDFRISKMRTEEYEALDKFRYLFFQLRNGMNSQYIINKAPLNFTCCMVKNTNNHIEIRRLNRKEFVCKAVQSHQMENIMCPTIMNISTGKLYEYLTSYALIFPESKVASYWRDYSLLIEEYLTGEEFLEICLPKRYTSAICEEVSDILERRQKVSF